jgi:hypothetical protein
MVWKQPPTVLCGNVLHPRSNLRGEQKGEQKPPTYVLQPDSDEL